MVLITSKKIHTMTQLTTIMMTIQTLISRIARHTLNSEYWLWDLALSCDQDASNATNCECTSAAIRLQNGDLQCPNGTDAAPYCPDDCDLCDTCLTLLGCAETKPPGSPFRPKFNMSMLVYLLAALAGVLLGVIGFMVHSKKEQPLKEGLVSGEVPPAGDEDNVWLAPVSN